MSANQPSVLPLRGKVQPYAWGSRTAIYELLGTPPTGEPAAELWFGTHPVAPAEVAWPDRPVPISEVLADDLPFLLKVLAAEQALSIQVHPSAEQARAGFDREQRAGVPLEAPNRNYKDPHHKPELIVALTPFRALAGIRDRGLTLTVVDQLAVPLLQEAFAPLALDAGGEGVAATLRGLLSLAAEPAGELVSSVSARACELANRPPVDDGDVAAAVSLLTELSRDYPGDIGVVVALLLNDVTLAPGQGLFQPARLLHAYVRGVGIEVMASSDNVLRAALTAKHVDVDELLAILDPTPTGAPILDPEQRHRAGLTVQAWPVPVTDFALRQITGTPSDGSAGEEVTGPAIVLAIEAGVEVRGEDGGEVRVRPGRGALVLPGAVASVAGGSAFVASSSAAT